jgi:hypothetical protein
MLQPVCRPSEEHVGDDYNPQLAAAGASDIGKGSPTTIEDPAQVKNLRWQTRPAPLTESENTLADVLQTIFAGEIYELDGIVERLNEMKIAPPAGASAWTEDSFRVEIRRLAGLAGSHHDRA